MNLYLKKTSPYTCNWLFIGIFVKEFSKITNCKEKYKQSNIKNRFGF